MNYSFDKQPLILIVDDNPSNIQILAGILSKEQYQITFATSGSQVFDLLKTVKPDLILLDIIMPEKDGYAVCRELKKVEKYADIPIIFLTAKNDPDDVVNGFEAGGVDYIVKPFQCPELLARVKTHVELKQTKDRLLDSIQKLEEALVQVKQLSGLLPICSYCKNIRDDKGYWKNVEEFIEKNSSAQFSHSVCPACLKKHYPDIADSVLEKCDEK